MTEPHLNVLPDALSVAGSALIVSDALMRALRQGRR
jgi:hypothetical protein